LLEILLDQLQLMGPPSFVAREGSRPALERNALEAGFRDRQQSAVGLFRQPELDERGRLGRIIGAAVGRMWIAVRDRVHYATSRLRKAWHRRRGSATFGLR
jgi:hypothetical protein